MKKLVFLSLLTALFLLDTAATPALFAAISSASASECDYFYKIYVTKEAKREMKKYKTLKKGDKSKAVRKMKERLVELGYLACCGDVTKKFDQETKDALLDFQLSNNLTGSDGVAYPYTQYKLFDEYAIPSWGREYETLSRGDQSWDVANLQKRLADTGYLDEDAIGGVFNDDTECAVILFQRENGLDEDGVAYDWLQEMLFSPCMNSCPEDER